MDYDVFIGLEIHVEQKTNTKIFCSCRNAFGSEPNTNCCPVCLGLPGALPIINQQAVRNTIKAGLALGCEINDIAVFERKNYFYPDLAKTYQISQLVKPICLGGGVQLDNGKFVKLNRIHLEEDAGKLIHVNEKVGSLIDFNRAGVPLMEIVTEGLISPMENADEVVEFVTKLRNTIIYTGVAECKMEEGGMRVDVNLSVRPKGSTEYGTRTEMKNLNSYKLITKAISYEMARQIAVIEAGGKVTQETRRWNDALEQTESLRSKEDSQDYRYFPDPDILAISIDRYEVKRIQGTLPILPERLRKIFKEEYGLPEYDIEVILKDKDTSKFYTDCVELFNEPKTISNWLMTNVMAKVKEGITGEIEISPKQFTDIISMTTARKISKQNAMEIFSQVWGTTQDVPSLAKSLGMLNDMSSDELYKIIDDILVANPQAVNQYATDGDKILNFLTGQTMRMTKGKADSKLVRDYLLTKLK